MFRFGFGINQCTDNFCEGVYPLIYMRMQALYRFFRYVASGLHTAFLFTHAKEQVTPLGRANPDVSCNLVVGLEVRGILPILKNLEIWESFMPLGYSRSMSQGDSTIHGITYDYSGYAHGYVLGFGFGGDYYITKNIAAGLNFYLYKPWYSKVCYEEEDESDCVWLTKHEKNDIGVRWSVGLVLTYFLPI